MFILGGRLRLKKPVNPTRSEALQTPMTDDMWQDEQLNENMVESQDLKT